MPGLRPYQDEAADFLYERDRGMILAPVGAGKTAITLTAMAAMVADGHVRRWLVLAPKRVCTDVWPVEGPKWAPGLTIAVAVGTPRQREAAFASGAAVVVTNYDNLQALTDLDGFDGIVFDELTRLKNPSGKRFKALEAKIERFRVRWGLTGSFTSNGLEDVFGQCKVVDQSLLGRSKGAFLQKYFVCLNREYGEWAPRKGALGAVMDAVRPATFVLEPGEYRDKLPPLHTVVVPCALPDEKPYEQMKQDFIAQFPDAEAVAVNAAVVTQKLQQMAAGFIYITPDDAHWFSDHKLDLVEEIYCENQQAPVIVVYNYRAELRALKKRFPFAATLDEDDDMIGRWNAGKVRMLLIHPKSAGHGLNLQAGGHHMIWTSLPWSLELYEQTIGRLHRSGQQHDVWCYVLETRDTIDETIRHALHDKRSLSDLALEALK